MSQPVKILISYVSFISNAITSLNSIVYLSCSCCGHSNTNTFINCHHVICNNLQNYKNKKVSFYTIVHVYFYINL